MTTAEDRDQWERDEEALRAQESAQISTHSPDEGSRVAPDPARVARYAEAIADSLNDEMAKADPTWEFTSATSASDWGREAQAVVALADEERAPLVAEVERLRGERDLMACHVREARELTEAAEAKVAKVEALHVRIGLPEHHRTEQALAVAPDRCSTCWIDGNYAIWPCPTIAVLADAPAECGAEHPTNPSVVPCVRDVGHEGSHMSTTGCDDSVMHWHDAPAEGRAEGGA